MKLYLVRHGQTDANMKRISQGWFNSQLTEKGIDQAKKLAFYLKSEKIHTIYSSDLDRARNTAKEILRYHPETRLILTRNLREQGKGIFEGKSRELSHQAFEKSGKKDWWEFVPEGGESYDQVLERVVDILEKLKNSDGNVLIVSHGGPIQILIGLLLNEEKTNLEQYEHHNTGFSVIEYNPQGKNKIIRLNCTDHLK